MDIQTQPQPGPPQAPVKFPNKRISALLIDLILVMTVSRVIFGGISMRLIEHHFIPVGVFLEPLYFLVRDALFGGRSFGKLIVGLAVVDLNGNRCGLARSILRNFVFALPDLAAGFGLLFTGTGILGYFFSVFFFIEYLAMTFSPEGRRFGDRLAKTRVIDTRPHLKDFHFLWLSIFLAATFFTAEPLSRFLAVEREAKTLVSSLQEYKKTYGGYPRNLDQLKSKPKQDFIYTPYDTYEGLSEFFLTGMAVPFPGKISYSSERKEWRIHKGSAAWSREELGMDEDGLEAEKHNKKGNEFERNGTFEEAVQEYREAVRLKPKFLNAQLGLAQALQKKGSLDDALREYQAIIQWKPDSAEAQLNRFLISLKQQHFAEALEAHKAYLKLASPEDEKQQKEAEKMDLYLEEQIKGGSSQAGASILSSIEKEAPQKEKSSAELVSRFNVGTHVTLVLKRGPSVSGKIEEKDSRGFWLEAGKGARVYFTYDEVQSIKEA